MALGSPYETPGSGRDAPVSPGDTPGFYSPISNGGFTQDTDDNSNTCSADSRFDCACESWTKIRLPRNMRTGVASLWQTYKPATVLRPSQFARLCICFHPGYFSCPCLCWCFLKRGVFTLSDMLRGGQRRRSYLFAFAISCAATACILKSIFG